MKFAKYMLPALCAATVAVGAEEPAAATEVGEAAKAFFDTIEVAATVEVSAGYFKQGDEKDTDINLDTVEVDLEGDVTDGLHAFIGFLYEEGEEDNHVTVDQAYLTYALPLDGLSVVAGRITMPFGVYETGLISDPLTLQLGEITDAAVGLAYESEFFDANAYVFGGDIEDDPEELCWLASVTLKPAEGFSVWAGLVSDIAECALDDDINDALDEIAAGDETLGVAGYDADYDAAMGVNAGAMLDLDGFKVCAEYVAAVDNIEIDNEKAGKPQAWSVDVVLALTDELEVAARYEGSKDLDAPESQFGFGGTYAFNDNLSLSLEYLYGQWDDDEEDVDDSHAATAKVALEF